MFYHMLAGHPPLSDTRDRVQRLSVSRFREIKPIREWLPDIPIRVEMIVRKSMELNPDDRYGKPIELLVDLQKAIKEMSIGAGTGATTEKEEATEGKSRRVMLVESNIAVQDALRKGLKKQGYRVLVLGDPERALKRLREDPSCADCVIVSSIDIGSAALELFNRLTKSAAELATILLLGKNQTELATQANTSEQHVTISMPLRMRQLRKMLLQLLDSAETSESV